MKVKGEDNVHANTTRVPPEGTRTESISSLRIHLVFVRYQNDKTKSHRTYR